MTANLSTIELPPLPEDLSLPPLPELPDDLAAVAFTHSSYAAKPRRPTVLEGDTSHDWEKLEFIGDGILGGVISTLIHRLFPGQPPGTATILKSLLVRNTLLAEIARRYALQDRIRASPESILIVRNSVKSQACLFEAYIAAVYYQTLGNYLTPIPYPPTEIITKWLEDLYTPVAQFAEAYMRDHVYQNALNDPDADLDAEADGGAAFLNTWVSVRKGKKFKYENGPPVVAYQDESVGDSQISLQWRVRCVLFDGRETYEAEAVRQAKNAAKNVAAWKVCKIAGIEVEAR